MSLKWFWAAACMGVVSAASADEVLFKSGDRLTGKVKLVDSGKMTFESKVAGTLTLKMADIKTFSTDGPVKIETADGSFCTWQVAAADEGFVGLVAENAAEPQPLALADVVQVRSAKVRWKGVVASGAALSRGNTDSSAFNVTADASRRSEKDRVTLGAGYYYAEQRDNATRQDSLTSDNWFLKGQYDYFFTKAFFGYANLRYEKDRIANLDMRVTPGLGLGYQWIEREDLNFDTEVGGSWLYERYTDPEETRTYMAGRFAYHLDKAFNGSVRGFHNLELIPSVERFDTFLANADVGVRASLTAQLVLEVKSQMAYNSQPAEDRDNMDLRHILSVGWKF